MNGWFSRYKGSVPSGGDRLMYRMTVAGQWRRIFSTSSVKEQVCLIIIWSVYLYFFCRLRNGNFCAPAGSVPIGYLLMLFFFLLIYRKRKFCAEPMRERLTFHFELRTRSGNFRFFFLFFFSPFFLLFSNQGKISSCNTVYFCVFFVFNLFIYHKSV